MNHILNCSWANLSETLLLLREGEKLNCETVVLWLGLKSDGNYRVSEVYRPQQEVDFDFFRIPSTSMRELMGYLRKTRMRIIAQVHSHPAEAFHSRADDKWAIVRHAGAISVVVPYFARGIDENTFSAEVATFQLSTDDSWTSVNSRSVIKVEP
jgi:hypothetical protein